MCVSSSTGLWVLLPPCSSDAFEDVEHQNKKKMIGISLLWSPCRHPASCFLTSAHWQNKSCSTIKPSWPAINYTMVEANVCDLCACITLIILVITAFKDWAHKGLFETSHPQLNSMQVHHRRATPAHSCMPWKDEQWRSAELYVNYSDCVSLCDNPKDSI